MSRFSLGCCVVFLVCAFCYLMGAFVAADMDIREWAFGIRVVIAIAMGFFSLIGVGGLLGMGARRP